MAELSLDAPGSHLFIRSFGADGINVDGRLINTTLVLNPRKLVEDWSPETMAELDRAKLEFLLTFEPELVLLGCGAKQTFLSPELQMVFLERRVGIEVMTTEAACRTFNVLVSEGREVLAALLPISAQ